MAGSASSAAADAAQAALQAECVDDSLPELANTVKRKHVHYVHVRTHDASHVQPGAMTREQAWAHMEKVYKEAYPVQSGATGSILSFGAVAKERHASSKQEEHRAEHHHIPVFCTQQHYWNRVAKISREKYHVPLSAVAHDGYAEMYEYIKVPTAKKPLAELDAEVFLSPLHPRDGALSQLLEKGRVGRAGLAARRARKAEGEGTDEPKRQRLPSIFQTIKDNEIRSVAEFKQFANKEAQAGRVALAEYYGLHFISNIASSDSGRRQAALLLKLCLRAASTT